MKQLFLSRSKKLRALVFINALLLGLTGMVHAHPDDPKDEYTQKPAITEEKPANKPDTTNEAGEKQSKQEPDKPTGSYKGAQPPQGGRSGQGQEHHD